MVDLGFHSPGVPGPVPEPPSWCFVKWAIQGLTFNRGSRLITGVAPTDFDFSREVSDLHSAADAKPESRAL